MNVWQEIYLISINLHIQSPNNKKLINFILQVCQLYTCYLTSTASTKSTRAVRCTMPLPWPVSMPCLGVSVICPHSMTCHKSTDIPPPEIIYWLWTWLAGQCSGKELGKWTLFGVFFPISHLIW